LLSKHRKFHFEEISVTIVNTLFCNASVIASQALNRGMSKKSGPPLEFTFPSPHHHHSFNIYAITNIRHICSHRQYRNQSTYMYSPTILQPINIYVFTNHITTNQHICIHQHRFYHIIQQHHIISHKSSEEKIHHTKINIIFNT